MLALTVFLSGYQFYEDTDAKQNCAYVPQNGYVPDQETAIKIAEAILSPILGKGYETERPFVATLKEDSIWVVRGTLKSKPGKRTKGGVAYLEIRKSDCRILYFKRPK